MERETVGNQPRPCISLYMNNKIWGVRNWSVIPRAGDYICVEYRANRHAEHHPTLCLIDKVVWDESPQPAGAPVYQLIQVYARWPDELSEPDLT